MSKIKISSKLNFFWQKLDFWHSVYEERRRKPAWVFEQEFLWLCILPAFTKIFLEDSFQGRNFFLCALNPKFSRLKLERRMQSCQKDWVATMSKRKENSHFFPLQKKYLGAGDLCWEKRKHFAWSRLQLQVTTTMRNGLIIITKNLV